MKLTRSTVLLLLTAALVMWTATATAAEEEADDESLLALGEQYDDEDVRAYASGVAGWGLDATEDDDEDMVGMSHEGRLLAWRRRRWYISYGALSANSVPCRPRSGRSYYTRNCRGARGRVRPYKRGCSAITRCYRYTS